MKGSGRTVGWSVGDYQSGRVGSQGIAVSLLAPCPGVRVGRGRGAGDGMARWIASGVGGVKMRMKFVAGALRCI